MANKAHHAGRHHALGTPAVVAAYADPDYRCPRCQMTRGEMIARYGDEAAAWVRGHKVRAKIANSPSEYQAEHARCSAQEGAAVRNARSSSAFDW